MLSHHAHRQLAQLWPVHATLQHTVRPCCRTCPHPYASSAVAHDRNFLAVTSTGWIGYAREARQVQMLPYFNVLCPLSQCVHQLVRGFHEGDCSIRLR